MTEKLPSPAQTIRMSSWALLIFIFVSREFEAFYLDVLRPKAVWRASAGAHLIKAYLIFVISFTQAGFLNSKFYTQKLIKTPKNPKNVREKVYYMQFLRSIWKILHLTECFYTGTARGARNNYQV